MGYKKTIYLCVLAMNRFATRTLALTYAIDKMDRNMHAAKYFVKCQTLGAQKPSVEQLSILVIAKHYIANQLTLNANKLISKNNTN